MDNMQLITTPKVMALVIGAGLKYMVMEVQVGS